MSMVENLEFLSPFADQVAGLVKKRNDAIKRFKGGTWGVIRAAALESRKHGLSIDMFHAGMLAACKERKVPEGTIKSYLNAARHLLGDLAKGKTPDGEEFTEEMAAKISITDVRDAHPKENGKNEGSAERSTQYPATPSDMYRQRILQIVGKLDEDALRAVLESLTAAYASEEEVTPAPVAEAA